MGQAYFADELLAHAEAKGPITIGLAGAGQMGTDIIVQCSLMPGIRIGAIAENNSKAAIAALKLISWDEENIVVAKTSGTIDAAIEKNKIAITDDLNALAAAGHIDVIIDATGNPATGTLFAMKAMSNGKHLVMLNVEADITIGRFLHAQAQKAGIVYTGAAGDEPACALELIDFARSLGLEIIAAGKGKNNPLKPDAVPDEYQEEAKNRNMNPRMLVEFIDGSKTAIEMVALANASGLVPDIPGMHGPKADRDELAAVLCPHEDGGILNKKGVVDYSIGAGVAPGVFCIVEARHPRILERMIDLKVGRGPYFALLRPYHLTSLEVPLSAARAVLANKADMVPLSQPVAEAVAVAKRDIKPGEKLGKIGEADYRGSALSWRDAHTGGYIPIGLAEQAVATLPIKAGEILSYKNCTPNNELIITQIRHQLDQQDARWLKTNNGVG